jgi:hypothetical protein
MKKIAILTLLSLFLFSSCKKDDTLTPPSKNYFPASKGSFWNLNSTAVKTNNGDYTLTATGTTKVINGKTYEVLTTTATVPTTESYIRREGSKIFGYAEQTIQGTKINLDKQIMDNDAVVGTTWETSSPVTINGFTITNIFKSTVTGVGLTRTVNSKVYTDVISIKEVQSYEIGGAISPFDNTEFYFANGIGGIESKSNFVTSFLKDYSIK